MVKIDLNGYENSFIHMITLSKTDIYFAIPDVDGTIPIDSDPPNDIVVITLMPNEDLFLRMSVHHIDGTTDLEESEVLEHILKYIHNIFNNVGDEIERMSKRSADITLSADDVKDMFIDAIEETTTTEDENTVVMVED